MELPAESKEPALEPAIPPETAAPGARGERTVFEEANGKRALTASMGSDSDSGSAAPHARSEPGDVEWQHETSAQRIAIELRHIEAEVRRLLEERDPKRKRKFAGTHRWHELEEDLIGWMYSGRFDQATLQRLSELIARRYHLFRQLNFVASTRPTWNT